MQSFRRFVEVFGAGCCVYAMMAACSSSGTGSGARQWEGANGDASSVGSSGSPVPNAMADEWYVPGSRLKVRYFEASDGAKQFLGWFDSSRDEECSFQRHADDGKWRCLPSRHLFVGAYFSGASCAPATRLAWRPKSSLPAPSTAFEAADGGETSRVFGTVAPYPVGPVYQGSVGSCVAADTFRAMNDAFTAGDEIPASAFVDAEQKTAQ